MRCALEPRRACSSSRISLSLTSGYYNCAEDYFNHGVGNGHNATYGVDFHDDKQAKCGAGCSRVPWEAAIDPQCYSPAKGAVGTKCWAPGAAPPSVPSDANRQCNGCDDTAHYSTTLIAQRAVQIIGAHPADTHSGRGIVGNHCVQRTSSRHSLVNPHGPPW